jgi:hypothetical protein
MQPAILSIATLTCSGTIRPSVGVSIFSFWYFLVTAVPCQWCLGGRPTPISRPVRAGDRHLNFYETRDNLPDLYARQLSQIREGDATGGPPLGHTLERDDTSEQGPSRRRT